MGSEYCEHGLSDLYLNEIIFSEFIKSDYYSLMNEKFYLFVKEMIGLEFCSDEVKTDLRITNKQKYLLAKIKYGI